MVYQFTDFLLKIFFMRMNIDRNDKGAVPGIDLKQIGVIRGD